MKDSLLPFLFGTAAGVLSAWGVGGGTLLLLCMTLFLGVDQAQAQGINQLYFLPTAAAALVCQHKNNCLDNGVCRAAIPAGILCAIGGALVSSYVDLSVFRKPFGLFLLYAGVTNLCRKRVSGT